MSRLITSGFELNSKTTGIEVDSSSIPADLSLVAASSGGSFAMRLTATAQASSFTYTPFVANQNTGSYTRIKLNITTLPSGNTKIISVFNVANALRCAILLTTTGQIQLLNASQVQVGSSSATLSTGVDYFIEIFCDASVTSGTITARLNGQTFATGSGNSTAGWSKVTIGSTSAVTTTLTFDDIAINDNLGTAQNSWPERGYVVRATPNAAGDSNGFATATGGTAGAANNYTRISEATPDGTTTTNASNTATSSDFFGVTVPTVPTNHVINCVVIGGQYANVTAADAATAFKWQAKKTSGGTVAQSSAIIPNSTTMTVNTPAASGSAAQFQLVLYTDPDGNPWTPATVASMQIGYILTAAGTNPIAVSNVFALVDYATFINYAQAFTANLGMSGAEPKQTNVPLTAGITMGGGFVKGSLHTMAASLGLVSGGKRFISRKMISNLTLTGGMTKLVTIPFSGVLGLVGIFTRGGIYPFFLSSSVSFSGAVSKTAGKSLAGSINFIGSFGRSFGKALTAVLGFSKDQDPTDATGLGTIGFGESDFGQSTGVSTDIGQLIVQYIKSKGLYFTGMLVYKINKNMASNLGFVSSTKKNSRRSFTGSISFITAFLNPLVRFYVATIGFAGTLSTFLRRAKRPAPIMAIRKARSSTPRISIHKRKP